MKKNNKLVEGLEKADNRALTANLAESNRSTLDACLDWFGKVGALRGQEAQALSLFQKALGEDPLKALKILFYGRDIRGGQGERQVFQTGILFLAKNYPDYLAKNLHLVAEYGYWKDLFVLFGTKFEKAVMDLLREQLTKDWNSKTPSLLAKWMPSENTSSKATRLLAAKMRKHLGMSPRDYRKSLSTLRARLKVVERELSAKNWSKINYSSVPSKANLKYNKAFLRNDETRYRAFLGKVEKGEAKINSGTLYPYEIVRNYLSWYCSNRPANDQALQALWDNLPDYLADNPHNGLVVCDVSGSMFSGGHSSVQPIEVSVSLALYMAERNKGAFHNTFVTFSTSPSFVKLQGKDLYTKVSNIVKANWAMSTDIQATFRLLLNTAVLNSVPESDMPEVIYIVSDMQFNRCGRNTNLQSIKAKYKAAGYTMPKLVFWNVNSYSDVPITKHDENTALVSGCTPNVFEAVLGGKTPVDTMNRIVESERYAAITI